MTAFSSKAMVVGQDARKEKALVLSPGTAAWGWEVTERIWGAEEGVSREQRQNFSAPGVRLQ